MPYTTIQPPFALKFRELPKQELQRYFQWFLGVIPQRLNQLAEEVSQSPGFETWRADYSPASLDRLGEWFANKIETRNRTKDEVQTIESRLVFPMEIPGEELTNHTFSLAIDIGMYFSQVLLKNYPSLKWELPVHDKKFADYGQPLLTGFGPVSLNPVRISVTLAYGLASKNKSGKRLRELYDYWANHVRA